MTPAFARTLSCLRVTPAATASRPRHTPSDGAPSRARAAIADFWSTEFPHGEFTGAEAPRAGEDGERPGKTSRLRGGVGELAADLQELGRRRAERELDLLD